MSEESIARLCRVPDNHVLRISGAGAGRFLQTMSTVDVFGLGVHDSYGDVARGLVLDSEGQIVDGVLIARSGTNEYLVLGTAYNGMELLSWLRAHATLETGEGERVFGDVQVEDESCALSLFVLHGPHARPVVEELCGPFPEDVDFSSTLCLGLVEGSLPLMLLCEDTATTGMCLSILVPIAHAETFWNLLLSFPEIDLEDPEELLAFQVGKGMLPKGMDEAAYLDPRTADALHLVRPGDDFVGARALAMMEAE